MQLKGKKNILSDNELVANDIEVHTKMKEFESGKITLIFVLKK